MHLTPPLPAFTGAALLAAALFPVLAMANPTPQTGSTVSLSSLDLSLARQSLGAPQKNLAASGKPLTIGGKLYPEGVGTQAESYIRLRLDGKGRKFQALVGLDDNGERFWGTAVQFWIEGDGKTLAKSRIFRRGDAPAPIEADLKGIKRVTLVAAGAGFGIRGDHANWIDARFEMASGAPKPEAIPVENATILTPKPGPKPRLTGPTIFGVRPTHPILFSITATGERPMRFEATSLPAGVKLDTATGELTGSVVAAGTYPIEVTAKNAKGKVTRTLRLVVGEAIALTPPMGWNSWNSFDWRVTQKQVEGAAKIMAEELRDHGWLYVNVDDSWQATRGGPLNAIRPNNRFPDMKGMVDTIHGYGLKAGIYSSPWMATYAAHIGGSADTADGTNTWATAEGRPKPRLNVGDFQKVGPHSFVANDMKQFAEWGFDYLKYDWNPIDVPNTKIAFDLMRASGRDIVFSLSNSARLRDAAGLAKYSQLWRTSGDMSDTWGAIRQNSFEKADWAPFQGPGHWNDEDMLVVGRVSVGEELHPTRLSPNEQYVHISQWCLLGSPLLIGCDLAALDPFTLGLLTNDEVIDIDQDALGVMAKPIRQEDTKQVWAKQMEDGSVAVGLFNISEEAARMEVSWKELGLTGEHVVRDVWRQKDVARSASGYKVSVPRHGVVLMRLRPAR